MKVSNRGETSGSKQGRQGGQVLTLCKSGDDFSIADAYPECRVPLLGNYIISKLINCFHPDFI